MKKKLRKFTITTDKGCGGIGYARIKDYTCYIHSLMLFNLILLWHTPVRTGKKQIAKQISNRCVQIDGKLFDVKYYTDVNQLNRIWYRNNLGTYLKITEFMNYKQ